MARRDPRRHIYYKTLEHAHHQGIVNDQQYELLITAMSDDTYMMDIDIQHGKDGPEIEWRVGFKTSFDSSLNSF